MNGICSALVLAVAALGACGGDDSDPVDAGAASTTPPVGSGAATDAATTTPEHDAGPDPDSEPSTESDGGSDATSDPGSTSGPDTSDTTGSDAETGPDTISDSSPDSGDGECPTPGCVEYAAKMNDCYDVAVDWLSECHYVYEVCGIVECLPGLAGHVACVNTSSCDVIVDGGCNGLDKTC